MLSYLTSVLRAAIVASMLTNCCIACLLLMLAAAAPAKRETDSFKPLPPASTKPIADKDRVELEDGVASLAKQIELLRRELRDNPKLLAFLPDVEIYLNAVRYPLTYNEPIDVGKAKAALASAMARAKELSDGRPSWVTSGAARGYRSRIDGSAQPYLLSPPNDFKAGDRRKYPVLIFCHGRGEDLLELKFINGKPSPGSTDKPAIAGAFFVQPYGRYCCANKLAGEIDVLEILDSLRAQYPIDEDRVVLTGFSMGGAAVWHLAVHYADQWCAASPGAGFCETKIYQKLAERGELAATPWYEQALWHWYDAPDYVQNLSDVPLIAYAGTDDPQQQSGTIMEKAAAAAGVKMDRIWGQGVGHKYEPKAKAELDRRLEGLAAKGRNPSPDQLKLETWTLRYNRMFWLQVDGLDRHWRHSLVEAETSGGKLKLATQNVSALTVDLSKAPKAIGGFEIDGQAMPASRGEAAHFVRTDGKWRPGSIDERTPLKRHGLQGSIDDAFLDRFIMVSPTGKPLNEAVGLWAKEEMAHAIARWHGIFRGEAPVKRDDEISEADVASSNLVLWGDPSSNKVLAKIADKLPIGWNARQITLGSRTFDAATHAPVLIYPNPLNPRKYVVINSGFTFREDSNGTNSRQVPKLPDYAIVDLTTPPGPHGPGKIAAAGFFGERWELLADDGKLEP
jgi:predicted esterase